MHCDKTLMNNDLTNQCMHWVVLSKRKATLQKHLWMQGASLLLIVTWYSESLKLLRVHLNFRQCTQIGIHVCNLHLLLYMLSNILTQYLYCMIPVYGFPYCYNVAEFNKNCKGGWQTDLQKHLYMQSEKHGEKGSMLRSKVPLFICPNNITPVQQCIGGSIAMSATRYKR